jgi:hypothetical protein
MMNMAVRALRLGGVMLAASAVVAVASAWAVTVTQVPKSGALIAVACGSTQSCVAIGQGDGKRGAQSSLVRIDRGAVGAVTKLGTFSPKDVGCGSRSNCLAVGYTQASSGIGAAALPIRDGVAGVVKKLPGQAALFGVACPTASTCIAVGDTGTGSGGAAVDVIANGVPGPPQTVPGMDQLLAIACPSASDCVAVGSGVDGPAVITLTNGNPGPPQPVSAASLSDGLSAGGFSAVACATTTRCVAIGGGGGLGSEAVVVPISNGSPGPVELVPRTTGGFGHISCPTSTHCLATGVYQASRQGPIYNVSFPVSATGGIGAVRRTSTAPAYGLAIACPSAADCVYVGGRIINVANTITIGVVVTSGYSSKTGTSRAP